MKTLSEIAQIVTAVELRGGFDLAHRLRDTMDELIHDVLIHPTAYEEWRNDPHHSRGKLLFSYHGLEIREMKSDADDLHGS